jgi:hypothetical protein
VNKDTGAQDSGKRSNGPLALLWYVAIESGRHIEYLYALLIRAPLRYKKSYDYDDFVAASTR